MRGDIEQRSDRRGAERSGHRHGTRRQPRRIQRRSQVGRCRSLFTSVLDVLGCHPDGGRRGCRARRVGRTEQPTPCLLQVAQAVITLLRVAVQRPLEELGQPLAQRLVEQLGGDIQLGFRDRQRVDGAVAPHRAFTGRHLVQRDRGGVPLGVVVITGATAATQKRIEIAACTCLDIPVRNVGQREVEQHQLPRTVTAPEQPEVVRFDVAVAHAPGRQSVQGREEVVAETLQLVVAQSSLTAQTRTEADRVPVDGRAETPAYSISSTVRPPISRGSASSLTI